jgi:hypothetical protein
MGHPDVGGVEGKAGSLREWKERKAKADPYGMTKIKGCGMTGS